MSRYCENGGCTRPADLVAKVQGPERTREVMNTTALCQDCCDFLIKAEVKVVVLQGVTDAVR